LDLFDIVLQGDLKPEINNKDPSSWTALHYACLNGNYNIVLLLLKNEANIEIINDLRQTPLIVATQKFKFKAFFFSFKKIFKGL